VNLRQRLGSARWKEIANRDAVAPVRLGMDAQDLSARIVAIRGGALRIMDFAIRPLIERRKSIRVADECVITGRSVKIARGIKAETGTGMIRLFGQRGDVQKDLLRVEVQRSVRDREA